MQRTSYSAAAVIVALLFASATAFAAPPQVGLGVTVGGAGVGKANQIWDETVFHLGACGDVIFGRDGSTGFGACVGYFAAAAAPPSQRHAAASTGSSAPPKRLQSVATTSSGGITSS